MVNVNDKAPNFTLPDKDDNLVSLNDFLGKWVVLYFYPKDNTSGCTLQAQNYEASLDEFKKRDVKVIGISKDSTKSHRNFASKYDLTFTLLSDESKEVLENYGVLGLKKLYGREYMGVVRTTFVIDPEGVVRARFDKVSPKTDPTKVLEFLDSVGK